MGRRPWRRPGGIGDIGGGYRRAFPSRICESGIESALKVMGWRNVRHVIWTSVLSALCASLFLGTTVAAAAGQADSSGNPAAGNQSAIEGPTEGHPEILII